jgi:hypothetical protein
MCCLPKTLTSQMRRPSWSNSCCFWNNKTKIGKKSTIDADIGTIALNFDFSPQY